MTKIKTHTVLDCIEDLFKPFVNKKGEVEISENINPVFVMFIVMILGISRTFLLVIIDPKCPECGKKMHKHDVVDFLLNNTVNMKKQTYRCSDRECGCVVTPLWSRFYRGWLQLYQISKAVCLGIRINLQCFMKRCLKLFIGPVELKLVEKHYTNLEKKILKNLPPILE